MTFPLVLASASPTRAQMLQRAGVSIEIIPAPQGEERIKQELMAKATPAPDIALALAEFKAERVAQAHPDRLVLGADQVLDYDGVIYSKPKSPEEAISHLMTMRDATHRLYSAAVLYENGVPIWQHVDEVRLTTRAYSRAFIEDYVARNWQGIQHCVGCYKIEEEGLRLFERIEGSTFTILGLPLLEVLNYLTHKEDLMQ